MSFYKLYCFFFPTLDLNLSGNDFVCVHMVCISRDQDLFFPCMVIQLIDFFFN